jgi:formylglycine-generating enzyme required for sulfatase activity
VHVDDAANFALWMGGRLPSARQWDKAAGRFDATPDRLGPFIGSLADVTSDTVAVDRLKEGPLPVGQASADISPFGCHDMSGNGMEWTRDIYGQPGLTIPLTHFTNKTSVILRGRSYVDHDEPLLYKLLEDERYETEQYDLPQPDIGFRVVLELPPE